MTPQQLADELKQAVLAKAGKPYLSIPDEAWRAGVVAVLEGVRDDHLLMHGAGKAARAAVAEETRKYESGGAMAAQDSWDASVGSAVIDHLIREASE